MRTAKWPLRAGADIYARLPRAGKWLVQREALFLQKAAGAWREVRRKYRTTSVMLGRTVMAYDLDQFIADCRTILARDGSYAGREQVRVNLERLLGNADFVRQYCGDDAPRGLKVLYEDKKLGFQVLAHINDKARVSPPHDHGDSWAIYGQATKYTDMIEWKREAGDDAKHAELKPVKKYRLTPGHAGIYQNGTIHSIDYPDYARFIRVTGTNLDKIHRVKFDLKTGEVQPMSPQQAT
jgi:hypothetical protein